MTPPSFDEATRVQLMKCLVSLQNEVAEQIHDPVHRLLKLTPAPIQAFQDSLQQLRNNLQTNPQPGLSQEDLALLKTAVLQKLRVQSAHVEERSRLTPDHETKAVLEAQVAPLQELANLPWIKATEAISPPRLSDYLVPAQIEKWFGESSSLLAPRQYDEKFGILDAPAQFLPDLKHYRLQSCQLRGRAVCVAYVDIDDFKSFNTEFSEPRVDHEVLPRFMRLLEAAVYGQGHAYRFGGDEYVMLLPNRARDDAVVLLGQLQTDLAAADYGSIGRRPTISVGIYEVRHDSPLTDRQIEHFAAEAKTFAKSEGKNRIAGYTDSPPTSAGLATLT